MREKTCNQTPMQTPRKTKKIKLLSSARRWNKTRVNRLSTNGENTNGTK